MKTAHLEEAFRKAGFELDEERAEKFRLYLDLLQKWNKKHNLIASSTAEDIVNRHFLDSLSLVKCFKDLRVEWIDRRIADVGSGAGFPGCPLKIYLREFKLFLIESSQKKCAFLQHLKVFIREDWELLCKRAEEVRDSFDIVLARALGKFEEIAPLLERLSTGYVFVMKGKEIEEKWVRELGYSPFEVSLPGLPRYFILHKRLSPPSR